MGQRSEVGSQSSEVRDQRTEDGGQKTEDRLRISNLEFGIWKGMEQERNDAEMG